MTATFDRIRVMMMEIVLMFLFFQRGMRHLVRNDPEVTIGWWRMQRLRMRDSKIGLLPLYRGLFGANTFVYFRPWFTPERMGTTARAVAYLARLARSPRSAPLMASPLLSRVRKAPPSASGRARHDPSLGLAAGMILICVSRASGSGDGDLTLDL
jgi:hypothetical protein